VKKLIFFDEKKTGITSDILV